MNATHFAISLAATLSLSCAGPAPTPDELPPPTTPEQAIERAVAPLGQAPLTVGIVRNGEQSFYRFASGPSETSVLPFAAASQPLTALLASTYGEQGVVKLDEYVGVKTCSEKVTSAFCFRGSGTTYRHLLRNTSGLPAEPENVPTTFAPADLQDLLAKYEISIAPGKRMRVSTVGYAALGATLTRLTRTPYPDALQTLVLDPWGLDATTFAGSTVPPALWPAYGVRSSAADMLRVAEFHLYPDTAGDLADEVRDTLRVASQIEGPQKSQTASGWFYEPTRDVYWTASTREGASAIAFSPSREISMTMVSESNIDDEVLQRATLDVFDKLAQLTSPN